MNEAERLRTYLQGWDDSERHLTQLLAELPTEQIAYVIAAHHERLSTRPHNNTPGH